VGDIAQGQPAMARRAGGRKKIDKETNIGEN
jgi:hypothetical protein